MNTSRAKALLSVTDFKVKDAVMKGEAVDYYAALIKALFLNDFLELDCSMAEVDEVVAIVQRWNCLPDLILDIVIVGL